MIYWGINALNHDASLAVISNKLEFFKKSKEYNNIPKDHLLNLDIIGDAFSYGEPDRIFWYEDPWLKKTRQLYAGQYRTAFDMSVLPKKHLKELNLGNFPVTYVPHHASHAAAGYYTSPFNHASILVIDAIGEWECISIWKGEDDTLKKVWSNNYPNSIGVFYSAFTQLIGFTPVEQEFLLQKISAQGDWKKYYNVVSKYWGGHFKLTWNLHKGVRNWPYPVTTFQDKCDIAAAVQKIFENLLLQLIEKTKYLLNNQNIVYMGGCALNSFANEKIIKKSFDNVWSLEMPGDSSSSIGAVLYHTKKHICIENYIRNQKI